MCMTTTIPRRRGRPPKNRTGELISAEIPHPASERSPDATSNITDEWVLVTPSFAEKLLETNVDNRPVQQSRVERYAEDMKRGAWRLSHQGIAIGADGVLYDGQHRLWAVITACVSVRMKITYGLPPESRAVIDLVKPRTFVDSLAIAKGVKRCPRAVSWLRAIAGLEAQDGTISQATMETLHDRFAGSLDWMLARPPSGRPLARAAILGALVYTHQLVPEETAKFAERYASGVGLAAGSPVLALRAYVLERGQYARRDPDRVASLKTLRCVQAFIDCESITRIAAFEEAGEHFQKLHERSAGDEKLLREIESAVAPRGEQLAE